MGNMRNTNTRGDFSHAPMETATNNTTMYTRRDNDNVRWYNNIKKHSSNKTDTPRGR